LKGWRVLADDFYDVNDLFNNLNFSRVLDVFDLLFSFLLLLDSNLLLLQLGDLLLLDNFCLTYLVLDVDVLDGLDSIMSIGVLDLNLLDYLRVRSILELCLPLPLNFSQLTQVFLEFLFFLLESSFLDFFHNLFFFFLILEFNLEFSSLCLFDLFKDFLLVFLGLFLLDELTD